MSRKHIRNNAWLFQCFITVLCVKRAVGFSPRKSPAKCFRPASTWLGSAFGGLSLMFKQFPQLMRRGASIASDRYSNYSNTVRHCIATSTGFLP